MRASRPQELVRHFFAVFFRVRHDGLSERGTTAAPSYNEVSRYRKKISLYRGLPYSGDPAIKNYLVNNKNIRYSGATKLNNEI